MTGPLFALARLVLGTLYPAYASYKAVRTKNVREYVKWMMYWIVFAVFSAFESLADVFIGFWCPFYFEIKLIFLIWLISPVSRGSLGSSLLYRKLVHPNLMKREDEIDRMIGRFQEQSYNTVIRFASQGFHYVTNLVMTTAIRAPDYIGMLMQHQQAGRLNRALQADAVDGGPVRQHQAQAAPAAGPQIVDVRMQRAAAPDHDDLPDVDMMEYESFQDDGTFDLGQEIEDEIESPVREAKAKKQTKKKTSTVVLSSDEEEDDKSVAMAQPVAGPSGTQKPSSMEFSCSEDEGLKEAAAMPPPAAGAVRKGRGRGAKTKASKAISDSAAETDDGEEESGVRQRKSSRTKKKTAKAN